MADTTVPVPPRKRSWLKRLAWIFGILLVLLILLYLVGTSSAFFRGVILPRAGKAMNATITVSDAAISPFKRVVLRDLKVQTTGTDPLFAASEVRLEYRLMDMLGGNINVDLVSVSAPTITVINNPDGTSNLDPLMKSQPSAAPKQETKPATPGKAAQIDLKKLAVTDATIRYITLYDGGKRDLAEISQASLILENPKNGQTGKLSVGASIKMENNPPAPKPSGALAAKLNGEFSLALSPDLKPSSIQGKTRLDVTQASGVLAQAANLAANLDCNITAAEIQRLALTFQKGATPLGEVQVTGPFQMEKVEGRFAVKVLSIDKQLLNIAGEPFGLDFGSTTINATNQVELAGAGKVVNAGGLWNVNHFQVTRTSQTTPQLDLRADYSVSVDLNARNVVVRTLTLTGTQNGKPLLEGALSSPMSVNLGGGAAGAGDSDFRLTLSRLNLGDWQPFLRDKAPAGEINGALQLHTSQGGKMLDLGLQSQVANLTAIMGSNRVSGVSTALRAQTRVQLGESTEVKGSTTVTNLALKAFNGSMEITNLVINDPKYHLSATPLAATLQFDAAVDKQVTDLRQVQLNLTPTDRARNQVLLQGRVDMSDTNAITGKLKLSADALDITRYYEIFETAMKPAAAGSAPASAPAATPTPAAPTGPEKEPDAIQMPVRNFATDLTVGRFFLREIEMTNVAATMLLDGGKVVIKPAQLALNGAPVSGSVDLDMGVVGFKYDVTFNASQVPLAPLVNSFMPERRGQVSGTLTGNGSLRGAGTTGKSLQQNLAGKFECGTTNLNLQIANLRSPLMKTLINVIAIVPTIAKNPNAALSSLAGALFGGSSSQAGGWTDELSRSPIDVIEGRGNIAAGVVNLERALVQSPAFQANAHGTITLAEIPTNSTLQIPLTISVERSLAQKINFIPAGTPTNATYVKLPDYVTVKGTVGAPKTDINKMALVGTALEQLGGKIPGVDQKTGSLLQGLGSMLTGQKSADTNAPAAAGTNQPASTSGSLLQSVGGLLGGAAATSTNVATTNSPATNANPAGDLLNQLFRPRKK